MIAARKLYVLSERGYRKLKEVDKICRHFNNNKGDDMLVINKSVFGVICILSVTILLLTSTQLMSHAAPVAPFNKVISQPDGTKIRIIRFGDEWQNWYETEDGYTVIKDKDSGWWYYAEPDETDGIKKSSHAVGIVKPEENNIKKHLQPKNIEHPNKLK